MTEQTEDCGEHHSFSDRVRHQITQFTREMVRQTPLSAFAVYAVIAIIVAVAAVGYLVGESVWRVTAGTSGGEGSGETTRQIGVIGLVVAVLATGGVSYLVWWSHHKAVTARLSRPGARFVASFSVFGVVLVGCDLLETVLPGDRSAPADYSGWGIVWTLTAGFLEEPLFAALPTLIASWCLPKFRWCRRKWVVLVPLIAVSAVSRGLMHLYQGGDSCVLAMLWGAVAATTFAVGGSLLGLIAAHVLHNLTLVLVAVDDNWWWAVVSVGMVAVGALWSILHRQNLIDVVEPNVIDNKGDRSHAATHGHS